MAGYTPLPFQSTLSLPSSSSSSSSSSSFDETEKFIPDLDTNDNPRFILPPPSPLPPQQRHNHRPPRSLLKRTLIFLLPSFLQPGYTPPTPKSPTAYLDGIRGLAALFVFFCHYLYTCYTIATGYGYIPPPPSPSPEYDELGDWSDAGPYNESTFYYNTTTPPINPYQPNHNHWLKLPFLRLLYSGPPMVAVFFVISGYALSLKPLTLLSAHNFTGFSSTLSSLIFRRGMRLFLPPALSTLFIVVLVRLGCYSATDEFAHDFTYVRNVQETHYAALNTTSQQLGDWAVGVGGFIHVWDWEVFGGLTRMDVHLWTIPVEFRASMILFLVLIGTARVKRRVRWWLVGGVGMGYCFGSGRWEMMLFLWGMGLAEFDVYQGREQHKRSGLWGWTGLSLLGLFFMSQPDQGSETTPGWVVLTGMIPGWWVEEERYRYYQSLGAALFVLAVGRSKGWQGVFTWGPVQYLGRISYALYLMHGPVLHTFGYAVERFVWTRITGVETEGMYNLGFGLAALVIVPAVIWVSDVFWRGVDAPVVRFARWVEGVCSAREWGHRGAGWA